MRRVDRGMGFRVAGCELRVAGCEVRVSAGMKLKVEGARTKDKGKRIKDTGRRQSVKQAGWKKKHALSSFFCPLHFVPLTSDDGGLDLVPNRQQP